MMPSAFGYDRPVGKGFRSGTERTLSPEQTLARILPLRSMAGITRIADITGLDYIGIPVVTVYRPNSRSLAVAQGKGLDPTAARVSGIMEALEIFHAETISQPLISAGVDDFGPGRRCADVQRLPRLRSRRLQPLPRMRWICGHDLLNDTPTYVPYALVHVNYTCPAPADSGYFAATSNGLASGNHPLEALVHGLCELIERDALSIARCGEPDNSRLTAPRLRLESVDDESCRRLMERIDQAGLDLTVWDITSDIGIPCFYCQIREPPQAAFPQCALAEGSGCHLDPALALSRALSEAAQSRLTIISGSREDLHPALYRQRTGLEPSLPQHSGTVREFSRWPAATTDSFDADLERILAKLAVCGIGQVIALDLSKPGLAVAVVRVIVPGLETTSTLPDYLPGPRASAAAGSSLP